MKMYENIQHSMDIHDEIFIIKFNISKFINTLSLDTVFNCFSFVTIILHVLFQVLG